MDPSEIKVLISYKELDELISAVNEIPQLREENRRYYNQVVALKGVYNQLLDRVNELMKLI